MSTKKRKSEKSDANEGERILGKEHGKHEIAKNTAAIEENGGPTETSAGSARPGSKSRLDSDKRGNSPPTGPAVDDPAVAARKLAFEARERIRGIQSSAFSFKKDLVRDLAKSLEPYMRKNKICAYIKRALKGAPISPSRISQALDDSYKDPTDAANGRKGGEMAADGAITNSGAGNAREISQKMKAFAKKIPVIYPYACSLDSLAIILTPSLANPEEKYLTIPAGLTQEQEQMLIALFQGCVKAITSFSPKAGDNKVQASHKPVQLQGGQVKKEKVVAKEEKEQTVQKRPRAHKSAKSRHNADPDGRRYQEPQRQQEQESQIPAATPLTSLVSRANMQEPTTVKSIPSSKKDSRQHNQAQKEEKEQDLQHLPDDLPPCRVVEDSEDSRVIEFYHGPQQPEYGSQPEYPSPLKPKSNYYPPAEEEEQ